MKISNAVRFWFSAHIHMRITYTWIYIKCVSIFWEYNRFQVSCPSWIKRQTLHLFPLQSFMFWWPHAVSCNTVQHTATHCNTLQHTATHCNSLQQTAGLCHTKQHTAHTNSTLHTHHWPFCLGRCICCNTVHKVWRTATQCTNCGALLHTAQTAAHCNILHIHSTQESSWKQVFYPICAINSDLTFDLYHSLRPDVLSWFVPLPREPGSICASFQWTGSTPNFQDALRADWPNFLGTCCILQHTATHYKLLQHTATYRTPIIGLFFWERAVYCNTLQHAATCCNTLRHAATHCTLFTGASFWERAVHISFHQQWRTRIWYLRFLGNSVRRLLIKISSSNPSISAMPSLNLCILLSERSTFLMCFKISICVGICPIFSSLNTISSCPLLRREGGRVGDREEEREGERACKKRKRATERKRECERKKGEESECTYTWMRVCKRYILTCVLHACA